MRPLDHFSILSLPKSQHTYLFALKRPASTPLSQGLHGVLRARRKAQTVRLRRWTWGPVRTGGGSFEEELNARSGRGPWGIEKSGFVAAKPGPRPNVGRSTFP